MMGVYTFATCSSFVQMVSTPSQNTLSRSKVLERIWSEKLVTCHDIT